ncbi:glycosyltransferase [Selenomonas ruminantium]|uniref:rhamnosyltransferase WsaF family glycosyltransferase n=1 Tax=Selenomonas ruminantium TaxID=971 RepID=UPI000691C7D8|nr:glycosyltransferase [Selenomonas ruminantium]
MRNLKEMTKYKLYTFIKGNRYAYALAKKVKNNLDYWNANLKQITYVEESVEEKINVKESVTFSILVPLYNTPKEYLKEMIDSVLAQSYKKWELCLLDGSDDKHQYVNEICEEYSQNDDRIKYERINENKGISGNTNECAHMATGEYLVLLDHDDTLSCEALMYNAYWIEKQDADVLYSDEDHISIKGVYTSPFFKPDWSPDLLYSQMYVCHLLVIKRNLFEQIGGFRSKCDGAQDYDLMLRLSSVSKKIVHIPEILYHWRESENSTASSAEAKPYAHEAGRIALDDYLKGKYGTEAFAADGAYTFCYDARFKFDENKKASIIIPMKDKYELTDACVKSIIEKSNYSNYEIIILDNNSEKVDTISWLEKIIKFDKRIRVEKADMEFNWSKINNYGVSLSSGDVFVFLNNDTVIISNDWLERLMENAMRKDTGVVGAMLLYEDDTIQHAGVVVGMNGWADHVFKAQAPVHMTSPFASPALNRNVLAVTGACMAVSRKTWMEIGGFDEEFVICGSDVELGIRAHEKGLFNLYNAQVKLYHLESKSRDEYIPEVDFRKSREAYYVYWEKGDPYYNKNLSLNATRPEAKHVTEVHTSFFTRLKNKVKRYVAKNINLNVDVNANYAIPEIMQIDARKSDYPGIIRLNLLIPSLDQAHVFGGISTAIRFFYALQQAMVCDARIIILDAPYDRKTAIDTPNYISVSANDDFKFSKQIVPFADRFNKTIPVRDKDIFIATGWWTAYNIKSLLEWQAEVYQQDVNPLIYMIQDYEPGFYSWSSRHALADSTYKMDLPVYAVINSSLLHEFLQIRGYKFAKEWSFEPHINEKLAEFLPEDGGKCPKKKQILVYGRPSVERNAFSIIVESLKLWSKEYAYASDWRILSAGEDFPDINLENGVVLHSVGKLSLADYAKMMLDTYAGISLMISPHPSYPPLEMATFGVKVITNKYANKDLGDFNDNVFSIDNTSPEEIAKILCEITGEFKGTSDIYYNQSYVNYNDEFGGIVSEIVSSFREG